LANGTFGLEKNQLLLGIANLVTVKFSWHTGS